MIGSDQLLEYLLTHLNIIETIQLRLDPAKVPQYQKQIKAAPTFTHLAKQLEKADLTGALAYPAKQMLQAAHQIEKGEELFCSAGPSQADLLKVFRSLRFFCRAYEALYPLAPYYANINNFFLEKSTQENHHLKESLTKTVNDHIERSILKRNNGRGQRGGYTLYVPEHYSAEKKWPLVVALHGGSGHGADFFFSWLRSARSFECFLMAPSSKERTWSLSSPTIDSQALLKMLGEIKSSYQIDDDRILITGISDGGTFAMMAAAEPGSPYTHIAPVASAAHAFIDKASLYTNRKIYLVHGARDWMFQVGPIQHAAMALETAGAEIIYREIADLYHNYPRDENPAILRWFLA